METGLVLMAVFVAMLIIVSMRVFMAVGVCVLVTMSMYVAGIMLMPV
jgi:hypothetical protein